MQRLTHIILFHLILAATTMAQTTRTKAYEDYIEQYHVMAVNQMRRYHIPASITLAQGLFESAAGRSALALYSNNHFGIKCTSSWTGKRTYKNDDTKNDCFRVYSSPAESYEDHSLFLLRDRYKSLFTLNPLDYRGWAKGLKACGYATNPAYADRLIKIIELYELYRYDEDKKGNTRYDNTQPQQPAHEILYVNSRPCLRLTADDTWQSIAAETKVSVKKLLKYNEATADFLPDPGTNIFLKKKATKAAKEYKGHWHRIARGESMYSIAQQYGIQLKKLYKMNHKDATFTPVEGDILKVR